MTCKIMIIGVDAGVLGVSDDRLKVGVYHFVLNLLKALSVTDKDNQYFLYSFLPIGENVLSQLGKNFKNIVLRPKKGWLNIRLSVQFFFHRHDLFLGFSQAMPFYHQMKSIIYIYDLAFEIYPQHYRESYRRLSRQTNFAAKYSDRIIAVSNATKNDLVKLYKINEDKIKVIYHGVSINSSTIRGVPTCAGRHSATSEVSSAHPYFLFVGSYKPSKNIPNIIKAFSLFTKDFKKPYQLVLAGSNYWLKGNEAYKGNKGAKIVGYVPDDKLVQLYRNAIAFVSPSFYEGFGMPLLEAMACGVPVITSNRGSIPEVVGDAAIMVEPSDIDGLKDAMLRMATDEKLKDKMIKKGLDQAQKFSWEKSARQLLDIINSL